MGNYLAERMRFDAGRALLWRLCTRAPPDGRYRKKIRAAGPCLRADVFRSTAL